MEFDYFMFTHCKKGPRVQKVEGDRSPGLLRLWDKVLCACNSCKFVFISVATSALSVRSLLWTWTFNTTVYFEMLPALTCDRMSIVGLFASLLNECNQPCQRCHCLPRVHTCDGVGLASGEAIRPEKVHALN